METTFKAAEIADREILVEFIKEYYDFDGHCFHESIVRTTLAKILKNTTLGRVWVIQRDGKAIGYIVLTFGYSLEYGGRDAFIDEFYIRESYRGRGIGSKAIQFIESACPALDIQAVHLEVERKNIAAQKFYREVGFKDQERYLMTKWIATPTAK